MTLRKKHLKIGALILLGICVLGGIALGVYFLFFHKEKSEPEPPYTTLIASTLRADTLSDITVTDNGSGDCYTFTDSAACTALLEGLQEIHLYRGKQQSESGRHIILYRDPGLLRGRCALFAQGRLLPQCQRHSL